MTLRLFAALSLPEEVLDRLDMLQRDLPGAAWRERENLHLTLAYFGDVHESAARELDTELASLAHAPFELALQGAGYFGRREPTALWVGVAANPALERLASNIARVARSLGVDIESRTFKPHVTLAYCKGARLQDAATFQHGLAEFRTEPFWVDQFELYSSRRTKAQNRYVE